LDYIGAITIFNSGSVGGLIKDCELYAGNVGIGIRIYNSDVEIRDNQVIGFENGLTTHDNSNVLLEGDKYSFSQTFSSSWHNFIYASANSFPYHFNQNYINTSTVEFFKLIIIGDNTELSILVPEPTAIEDCYRTNVIQNTQPY